MRKIGRRQLLNVLPWLVAAATPAGACAAPASPDDRINAAIEQIRIGLAEKYPGCRIQVRNDTPLPQRYVQGKLVDLPPDRQAVVIYATNNELGMDGEVRWFINWPAVDNPCWGASA